MSHHSEKIICPRRSQAGFSLVEVLVGIGIMGIVAVGLTVIITSQNTNSQSFNLLSSRLSLARVFNHAIRNGRTLLQSATYTATSPNNAGSPYDYCVNGTGGVNGCVARNASGIVYNEFFLLDPSSTVLAPYAGPAASNILYDTNGIRCAVPSSKCFMRATAKFNAFCPGNALSCQQAQSVRVTFSLAQLPNLNLATPIRPVSGTYSLQVGNIVASGVGTAGFIPYWNTSLTLANSMITQGLPGPDIGMSAQALQLNGNANFFQNVAVAADSLFDKDLAAAKDFYSGNIVGANTNMNAVFTALGNAVVSTATGINGNVWTGTLNIVQNLTCNISITAPMFFVPSDERLKEHIRPIRDARSRILAVRGVKFNWVKSGSLDDGFIAQQIAPIFPELIAENREGQLSVSYLNLIAPLSEAIKQDNHELRQAELASTKKIESLRNRLGPGSHF